MTLHAAKGLEFDLVILPGIEESIIPTTRSLNSNDAQEEERRLFYVGITRAKEHLLITYTKHRYSYGQMVDQLPSRFLHEIPSNLLPHEDCSYWSITQVNQFFADWFGAKPKISNVYIPAAAKAPADRPASSKDISISRFSKTARPEYPDRGVPADAKAMADCVSRSLGEGWSKGAENIVWKKNQPVKHAKYGIGTIENIEEKTTGDIHLTVRFKIGVKKIVAQFVQRV